MMRKRDVNLPPADSSIMLRKAGTARLGQAGIVLTKVGTKSRDEPHNSVSDMAMQAALARIHP